MVGHRGNGCFAFNSACQPRKSGYHKNVNPLRLLIPAVLVVMLVSGCTDQPRLRMIGSQAPDFTVKDSDHSVALHDLRGKVVVLNFWTTWCEPCIVEMPSLARMQKQMQSKVTVLAVSTDLDLNAYHR